MVLGDLVAAFDDLEEDATSSEGDNGDAGAESLRNPVLETVTRGELKSDIGIIQEIVPDCARTEIMKNS